MPLPFKTPVIGSKTWLQALERCLLAASWSVFLVMDFSTFFQFLSGVDVYNMTCHLCLYLLAPLELSFVDPVKGLLDVPRMEEMGVHLAHVLTYHGDGDAGCRGVPALGREFFLFFCLELVLFLEEVRFFVLSRCRASICMSCEIFLDIFKQWCFVVVEALKGLFLCFNEFLERLTVKSSTSFSHISNKRYR